jgi:hypothetical protein
MNGYTVKLFERSLLEGYPEHPRATVVSHISSSHPATKSLPTHFHRVRDHQHPDPAYLSH